jgi:transposase
VIFYIIQKTLNQKEFFFLSESYRYFREQAALEGAREAGRKLFLALLSLVEKALPKGRECDCGGGRYESRGRVQRELMSIVGDIVFNRQKLRCLGCGKERYPRIARG